MFLVAVPPTVFLQKAEYRLHMALSVLRSGSVRFFAPKRGNRGPQPVQTVTQFGRTATEPTRTGPSWFGCLKKPVATGFSSTFQDVI